MVADLKGPRISAYSLILLLETLNFVCFRLSSSFQFNIRLLEIFLASLDKLVSL